ncbi:MAG: DUF4012 domain-containing protein [Actinomycetota bacterium]
MFYTLAFALLLTVADAVYVAWRVGSGLTSSATALAAGSEALKAGDPSGAMSELQTALEKATAAEEALRHPSARLAGVVPFTSKDMAAVEALTAAASDAALAGSTMSEILAELGVSGERISAAFYAEGKVDVESLQRVAPRMSEAARGIFGAYNTLQAVDEVPSLRVIAEALDSTRQRLLAASESTGRVAMLFDLLPTALGADEERSYLLLFQALGESRGTGGVAGLYGVLTASDGELELRNIHPYSRLGNVESTDSPAWFEQNYSFQSALTQWPQANVSPNFPAVAQTMLSMYENSSGEKLDGVLAMDPLALSLLMQGTGPIEVGELNISPQNMDELLLVESYTGFPNSAAQNDFLAQVVTAFWDELSGTPADPEGLVTGFGEAIDRQHLKFYLDDGEEQLALSELQATGSYTGAGDMVQMLFTNNYSTNKVDYFLRRSTKTEVVIMPDGTARVDVEVTLINDAPRGEPDLLLGEGTDTLPPGGNSSLVSLLMPAGAQAASTSVNGEDVPLLTYQDEGHPVAWWLVDIPPRGRARLAFSYDLPDAVDLNGGGAFSLTLFPQTAVRPESYEIRVVESSSVAGAATGVVSKGKLTTPAVIEIAVATLSR